MKQEEDPQTRNHPFKANKKSTSNVSKMSNIS